MDIIGKTLETLQTRSDRNYEVAQQLPSLLNVNALDADKPVVNTIQKNFQDKIDKMALESNGDYSQLGKQILSLKSDLNKQLTKGELSAAQTNYNRFYKNKDQILEQLKKGDITERDATLAINHAHSRYKGFGEVDPVSGIYNSYQDLYVPKFDENKFINDAMDKVKADKTEKGISYISKDGKWIMKDKVTGEILSADKLFKNTRDYMYSDKDFKEYARFRQMVGDKDFNEQSLNNSLIAKAQLRSYQNVSSDSDRKWNPEMDFAQRERHHQQKLSAIQQLNAPESRMLPTDINGFTTKGDGATDFNKMYEDDLMFKNTATKTGKNNIGNPLGLKMNLENNPSKPDWFDETHPKYKNDPIYKTAIKAMKEQTIGSDVYNRMNSSDQKERESARKEYLDGLSKVYNTLSNTQSYDRRTYQLSEDRAKQLGYQAFMNKNLQVIPIDEKGNIGKESKKLLEYESDLSNPDDISKEIKEGKIIATNHVFPLTSGTYGTVIMRNGKRYLSKALVDPKIRPILEQEATLSQSLLEDGKITEVSLPYLYGGAPVKLRGNIRLSSDGNSASNNVDILDGNNKVVATIPKETLNNMSDGWHTQHNEYAKTQREKPKGVEFINDSNMMQH